ncbi:MAG TPA: HD domain-containing protein [Candidatus Obscuribacter sp.]|nr:HD domain-containing protein [Candidatus Obscuribacter sp.]MBK9278015.1 HD domain-containing protein [Candidatus Obscuribacter sp.]HMY53015.1 HD domain-containing protein [Candidatus Obscuribacter sp.]HNA71885.1 HD domain-containing protein [Candidatus Obscuribacter sp.]HNB13986.1 HD domain-containing protein [Candidatus Obscuribacter sp.]
MRRHKILVVDDEVPNLRLLRRVLSEEHDIFEAASGQEGVNLLEKEEISLIITDQRMPSMTGVQLLEQSLKIRPDAIKILLTGYTDVQALIDAINAGHVYKYIPKPWDADELKLTVRRALEAFELKERNDNLVIELSGALTELENLSVGTIRALADALDAKCDYTAGHSLRVSRIAVLIGRQMGLPEDTLRDIELGGILHDIGKIGVPESILWKPDKLTAEERSIMSRHPVKSAEIIGDLKGLVRAREYVKHHHEFFDGSGYPDGLEGENIPIGARIILVSDAYDAMTTDRPYRKAIGHVRAIEELRKLAGTQFDPVVVTNLLSLTEDGGKEMDKIIAEQFDESFIGLTLASVDPAKTGRQYREEAERRARLAGSEP